MAEMLPSTWLEKVIVICSCVGEPCLLATMLLDVRGIFTWTWYHCVGYMHVPESGSHASSRQVPYAGGPA